MTAPAGVAKTARTPPVTNTEELRERLNVLERLAGDRFEELELILSLSSPGIAEFERDLERHRHRLGEIEELGADWTIVGPPWSPSPGPIEWLQRFAAAFITN